MKDYTSLQDLKKTRKEDVLVLKHLSLCETSKPLNCSLFGT